MSRGLRAFPAGLAWALLLMLALLPIAPLALAQDEGFGNRQDGQHVADRARVIDNTIQSTVADELAALEEETGVDIVVYVQRKDRVGNRREARQDAAALLEAWSVGGEDGTGAVMVWNLNQGATAARTGVALGAAFSEVDLTTIDEAVNDAVKPTLAIPDFETALNVGVLELQDNLISASPTAVATPEPETTTRTPTTTTTVGERLTDGLQPPPGPPFPEPMTDVAVYDYAAVIDPAVIRQLEATIDRIETRTGAEVVVYSQLKPSADSPAATEQDAIALIDQWGVGREGFDDGLAIFFNLTDPCHGQVQLYAAPGYRAAYLTNEERQQIFEQEMLPALRECDFSTALLAAMADIDAAATAEHAASLQLARQIDAMSGLVVAPLLLVGLVGWAGWSWLRYGRDPEYLDSPSILMPAPPPGMSPAAAAVVVDGRAKRHALTTALVDLASRGEISFRASEDDPAKIDIDITVPDQRDPRLARNRRRPLGPAERYALEQLKDLGGAIRTIESDEVPEFAKAVGGFNDRLHDAVAEGGWFVEAPDDATDRWTRRGAVVLIAGIAGIFFGFNLPSTGLLLVGAAAVAAAIAMFVIARAMPQRTMEGARMYAQLAAYRRTLQKTLEQARTMDQVVTAKALPWVETPDQAMTWSYALGLHEEAEEVLERSMEDVRTGAASPTRTYFPLWYAVGARTAPRISGGARTPTAGLFSSGVVPDFTAMTAAISTIGSPPSSSGGAGGGGFGGGGSGGGGGGAGGGF